MPDGKGEMVPFYPEAGLVQSHTRTVHYFILAGMTSPPSNRKVVPLDREGNELCHNRKCHPNAVPRTI